MPRVEQMQTSTPSPTEDPLSEELAYVLSESLSLAHPRLSKEMRQLWLAKRLPSAVNLYKLLESRGYQPTEALEVVLAEYGL